MPYKDYWAMTDKDLVFMADRLSIIDMYHYGIPTHDDFDAESLNRDERQMIIDALIKRETHITSNIAISISVIALIISIVAIIF